MFYKTGQKKFNMRSSIRDNLTDYYPGLRLEDVLNQRPEWDTGNGAGAPAESKPKKTKSTRRIRAAKSNPKLNSKLAAAKKKGKGGKRAMAGMNSGSNSMAGASAASNAPSHFSVERRSSSKLRTKEAKAVLDDMHHAMKAMDAAALFK